MPPDLSEACQVYASFGYAAEASVAPLHVGYYEADFADRDSIDLDRAALDVCSHRPT
jgi:hypothetical protein